jgi:hypothetical protein
MFERFFSWWDRCYSFFVEDMEGVKRGVNPSSTGVLWTSHFTGQHTPPSKGVPRTWEGIASHDARKKSLESPCFKLSKSCMKQIKISEIQEIKSVKSPNNR